MAGAFAEASAAEEAAAILKFCPIDHVNAIVRLAGRTHARKVLPELRFVP
jgi:hypothetical protein